MTKKARNLCLEDCWTAGVGAGNWRDFEISLPYRNFFSMALQPTSGIGPPL